MVFQYVQWATRVCATSLAAMSTLLNGAFKSNFDYILTCLEINSAEFKLDFSFIQIHGMRE
jgi:hypothetical protein